MVKDKWTATFTTSEIVCLLFGRAPTSTPQFRLQNFLLRRENWRTNPRYSLHIGEQGETGVLRQALGPEKLAQIYAALEKYKIGLSGGDNLFPTLKTWWRYVKDVEKTIGKEIELRI